MWGFSISLAATAKRTRIKVTTETYAEKTKPITAAAVQAFTTLDDFFILKLPSNLFIT